MFDPSLILLSISPGIAISLYIFFRDKYEPEPKMLLLGCFLFGALSTLPAIWLEQKGSELVLGRGLDKVWDFFLVAFVVVAFSEELVKFLFLRAFVYPRRSFNEPMDGIVYAVVIGMGFATWENILYVVLRGGGFMTGMLRMFTAVPAHAAFGVIMGYFVGLAKHEEQRRVGLLITGFLGALLFHGAYDFFIFQRNLQLLAIGVLVVSVLISFWLIGRHQRDSFHRSRVLRARENITEND